MDVIKNTEYHNAVINNPSYDSLSEEGKLEEALAQAIGEKGVKILNESKKAAFANWFKLLFQKIAKGLGIRSLSAEKLSELSLDKYTDLVAAELLSGKAIVENKASKPKSKKIEADLNNIDFVISQQEAILKTKQSIESSIADKNSVATAVQKELVDYINQNLTRPRIDNASKRELKTIIGAVNKASTCLLYTSPSPRDRTRSRMPSSA